MARAPRFSEDWLKQRIERGYSAGLSLKNRRQNTNANILLAEAKAKSPHRAALARLEKNPDLVKGHQEHFLQVRLFDRFEQRHPEIYALMHATPNGGARSKVAGAEMQAEGQKKGYPDLSLDAPRGVYHGLRIEMKHGNNKPTKEQKEWLTRLSAMGYCCAVFNDLEAVTDFILRYWGLAAGESMPAQDSDSWWQESAA